MVHTIDHVDILMATDCRFPGGTTASIVEEIEAQYRAGYRVGLLHLPSPVQRSRRPFAERIRRILQDGKAELVVGHRSVGASLLIVRHPSVLSRRPTQLAPIKADHVVMVANQVPQDDRGATPYYDPGAVHDNIRIVFGREAQWAPIGPVVRDALEPSGVPMLTSDWENIIDLDSWRIDRDGFVSVRPVIGRHSRGHWSKWPATREDLLAAYPADPHYQVRILGGTEAPVDLLGRLPDNWITLPFNAVPVAEFLAHIDFFVYFHHPGLVEAFGRVILEALAAGAVCVVPPEFEPIFGDACHYGSPADVRPIVDALVADPEEFLRRSKRGVSLVQERFSYQAHLTRVSAIVGAPSDVPRHTEAPALPGTGTVWLDSTDTHRNDTNVLHDADKAGMTGVVLTTRPVQFQDTDLLVESVPQALSGQSRSMQEADLRRRLAHVVRAHRAKRVILLDEEDAPYTTELDEDIEVRVRPGIGDDERATSAPGVAIAQRPRAPQALMQRLSRQAIGVARRRAPRWVRRAGRALVDTTTGVRRGIAGYAAVRHPTSIPVPPVYSHLAPSLPVVLIVITSAGVAAGATLDAVLRRAQEASSFRIAVLAPSDWFGEANARRVTLETWVSEDQWPDIYNARWSEYARDRLTEVTRLVAPVAVVNVDRTIDVAADPASERLLDLLEAAALGQQ